MNKRNLSSYIIDYSIVGILLCLLILKGMQMTEPKVITPANYSIVMIDEYYFDQMVDSLKKYEGFRAEAYQCPSGQNTIGYGHYNVEDYTHVSEEEADIILRADLLYYTTRAHVCSGYSGNRALALGAMMFGMGEGGFSTTSLYKRIVSGDVSKLNFTDYCYINGKENLRRKRFLQFVEFVFNQK